MGDAQGGNKKKTIILVVAAVLIVGAVGFLLMKVLKKEKVYEGDATTTVVEGAPGLQTEAGAPRGEMGAPGAAATSAAPPLGGGAPPAVATAPPPSLPGGLAAEAPGFGPSMELGDVDEADPETLASQGWPLEDFRKNPFLPKEEQDTDSYAADFRVAANPVERIEFAIGPVPDAATLFATCRFPRPRLVTQPIGPVPEPLGIQPASWSIPNPSIPVAAPPELGGEAVRPVVQPPVEVVPRVGDGGAQPVGPVGPRQRRKPPDWPIRRVAGILHNGMSLALIEVVDGGETRIEPPKRPGDTITAGGRQILIRSIGLDYVVLREVGTTEDFVLRLRGRTGNEE
jgi:hypothetical protein